MRSNVIWWSASVSPQKPAMKSLDNDTPTDRHSVTDRRTDRLRDRQTMSSDDQPRFHRRVFFHAESIEVTQQRHTYRQTQCDSWTDRQTDNVIWWSASVSLQKPAMKSLDNNTPTDRHADTVWQTDRETDRQRQHTFQLKGFKQLASLSRLFKVIAVAIRWPDRISHETSIVT